MDGEKKRSGVKKRALIIVIIVALSVLMCAFLLQQNQTGKAADTGTKYDSRANDNKTDDSSKTQDTDAQAQDEEDPEQALVPSNSLVDEINMDAYEQTEEKEEEEAIEEYLEEAEDAQQGYENANTPPSHAWR